MPSRLGNQPTLGTAFSRLEERRTNTDAGTTIVEVKIITLLTTTEHFRIILKYDHVENRSCNIIYPRVHFRSDQSGTIA